jgi:hypothetical protein
MDSVAAKKKEGGPPSRAKNCAECRRLKIKCDRAVGYSDLLAFSPTNVSTFSIGALPELRETRNLVNLPRWSIGAEGSPV